MKQPKNTVTLVLMLSSIILLLALQVFWLMNSYERAYFDLRKEANGLFRTTIFAMRDSMIAKKIEHLPWDTTRKGKIILNKVSRDSAHLKERYRYSQTSSQVQIFISTDKKGDSLKAAIRPIVSGLQEGKFSGGGNFIFRIGPDSLSTDSIRLHFKKNLSGTVGPVPFLVKHYFTSPVETRSPRSLFRMDEVPEGEKETPIFSNSIQTEWVRFDPMHRYGVVLSDFRPLLLKEITPQILFSIFLTLLTSASFLIIYRSLRDHQRLMMLKNDFISNVTHELKTPIATVSVALEALQNFKGIENPKLTEEYLAIAQHELGRLSLLTDKVLTTSLFDENGIKIDLEKVDFEQVTTEILGSMRLVFEKQHAEVQFEKSGSDFVITGSTIHLTNVVYNLLDNALKYSPADPVISISLKDEGNFLTLAVSDKGVGIPREYHQKVFEKFFRMPAGDVHNIKGYGLGLSYVQSVAKAHRGTVTVESEPGQGSTFIMKLPRTARA